MKKFFIITAILLFSAGCSLFGNLSKKELIKTNVLDDTVTQLYATPSPDKTMQVYLEKEYDPNIERYVRQSVVLENKQTGSKLTLDEIKLSQDAALVRYSKDGWDKDRTADCTSLIDFNEFEPVRWIDNEKIKINQYFDNYECAGKVTNVILYNIKGEKLSEKNNLSGSLSN